MKLLGNWYVIKLNPQEHTQEEALVLQERCQQFLELGNTLLTLLQQHRWKIEEIKSSLFLKEVEEWKTGLWHLGAPQEIERLRRKLYVRSNSHLRSERAYLEERELELKNMISLLSEAIKTVSSENGDYYQHVLETTHNLSKISQLEDIKKIRSLLSAEVQQLKETVKRRQSQERQQFQQLSQHVKSLQAKLQSAVNRSLLDPLTGLYNRQGWDQEIVNACQTASVTQEAFTLAVADLDDFKKINDSAGHQVGDLVLTKLGKILKASFRSGDYIARYGGDEFAFILSTPSLDKAQKRLERLCRDIAKETYQCSLNGKDYYLKIYITCGLSLYRKGDSPASLIRRADEALYLAKKLGKNQVVSEAKIEKKLA